MQSSRNEAQVRGISYCSDQSQKQHPQTPITGQDRKFTKLLPPQSNSKSKVPSGDTSKIRATDSPDLSNHTTVKPSHIRNKITLVEMKSKENGTPLKSEASSVGKNTRRLGISKPVFTNFEAKHINLNIQTPT